MARFRSRDVYFRATHAGAELDLMLSAAGKRYGFEFKYADAPRKKRSMHIAVHDLGWQHLWVVYPGEHRYPLDEKITAIPLEQFSDAAQLKR